MMEYNARLQEYGQKILDMFNGDNSGLCIATLISVIEYLALSNKASNDFKEETIKLLRELIVRLDSSTKETKRIQ